MIKKNIFFILLVLVVILNLTVISAANLENDTISNDKAQITHETQYISDSNIQRDNTHSINDENIKVNNLKDTTEENNQSNDNILDKTKNQKNTLKADFNEETVTNYNELVNAIDMAETSTYSNYTINLSNGNYDATSKITWNPSSNCKTLIINGNNITLNGKNTYQFMNINNGATVILNNIILNNFTFGNGGAILNQGSLTITNSTLKNNVANLGGGAIYNYISNLTITNSIFANNTADIGGGAIYNYRSNLNITGTTFTNNTVNGATHGGGAIYNSGTININNSTLKENKATHGGAIYIYEGNDVKITVINSNLTNNNASITGGAIYGFSNAIINITDSNISNNSANNAGAIYGQLTSSITVTKSNFANNSANAYGGAILGQGSTLTIQNSNFTNNNAQYAGAIGGRQGSIITVQDSNFTNNSATDGGAIYGNESAIINILNSNFTNNNAGSGGAIYGYGGTSINVTSSILTNNRASYGGAINGYKGASINVTGSTLLDNDAQSGGAIFGYSNMNLTVTNSNFANNNASRGGGAITGQSESYINVINTSFTNNRASYGGSIYGYASTNMTVTGTNFTNNRASYGGAVYGSDNIYMNIANNNFINNKADGGGAIFGRAGTNMTVRGTNFTNNTPITWEITNESQVYNIKLLNDDEYVPDNGIVDVYVNDVFKGSYILTNGIIEDFNIPMGDIIIKLVVNGTDTEKYSENTYILESNFTSDISMNVTNTTVNQGDMAVIFIKFNDTVNNGIIQISNQTNTLKNINILEETDFIVAAIDTTNFPYADNIINIKYVIDDYIVDYQNTIIRIRIPTTVTATLNNQTTINTSITVNVEGIEETENPTGIISVTNTTGNIIATGHLENGEVIISWSNNQTGAQEFIVKYIGDDIYQENSTTINMNILRQAIADVTILNNTSGNVTIKVDITTDDDAPLGEKEVEITLPNGTIDSIKTDENGTIIIIDTTTPEGKTNITIKVPDTSEVKGTEITSPIDIVTDYQKIIDELEDKIIELNNTINTLNNTVNTQNQTINDLNNKIDELEDKIKELEDTISLKNSTIQNLTDIINDLNEQMGNLESKIDELEEFINTLNKTSVIKAIVQNGTVDNTNVIVTLENKLGTPINNAPITIKDNQDNIIGNASTGEDGIAVIPVKTREGTQNITITYPGNDTYTADTTTITITTAKNNVTVKVDPINTFFGEKIIFTAYITDTNGKPVTGGSIIFKLNGKTLRNDGRFDSNAPAWKFTVKNGKATVSINADSYLRNTKNISATYTGSYKYNEAHSEVVTAQINKRNAQITVTATPHIQKQYETITFTAKLTDITPNHENKTIIHTNTKVLFKINGKTLIDKDGNKILIKVDSNNTASYNYTVPAGMSGITADGKLRNYTVEVVLVSEAYTPDARSTGTFNIQRSPTTINIQNVTVNNQNKINIKANLTDYKGNNLIGTNEVSIKVNGITYINQTTNKTQIFKVNNGIIDLKEIPITNTKTIKSLTIVTGARPAYLGQRNETTDIVKV